MSRIPRILPLVGVAIAGVVAINALEGGPGMLGAMKSFAEDVGAAPAAAPVAAAASAAAKPPAPVCAPTAAELAKEAGLSPAELSVLETLPARRGQLDQREQALQTELALLSAAEAKVDSKIKTFNDLKAQVQGLMGEADQKAQAEIDRLVTVYQAMRPQDAAAVMTQLDDKVRL